ncbi:MAG: lipase family protein [Gammaproteobacteria bacterium]
MTKPIRKVETILGLPNFSRLFPPPQAGTYDYFDGASDYPFAPNTAGHSPVNAWWMAELSLLAYSDKQAVERQLKNRFPVSEYSFFWLESQGTGLGSNTQGFGIETDDYIIIAFRGTEFPPPSTVLKAPGELRNILADLRTDIRKLSPQTVSDGAPTFDRPVHVGFAKALQSVWTQLLDRLTSNTKPLWLTGHSLGAAVATLLAYQLPERTAALYTFGSPCVGTPAFVESFNDRGLNSKTYRYLHGNDAVARTLDLYSSQYQHVGQLFQLDAGLRRGLLAYGWNIVLGLTVGINLFDHPPVLYSYECWNAIP